MTWINENTCANCFYSYYDGDIDGDEWRIGTCRRYPPILRDPKKNDYDKFKQPTIRLELDICGEFKRKPE